MATSLLPTPYTPNAACLSFGMWGRVLDIINHGKFQLSRFGSLGAQGGRKSLSPLDWRYHPYNTVRTNVLHCDNAITVLMTVSVVLSLWLWVFLTNAERCQTVADPQTKPDDLRALSQSLTRETFIWRLKFMAAPRFANIGHSSVVISKWQQFKWHRCCLAWMDSIHFMARWH